MKKKIKLNVADLKVQSFVTELQPSSTDELRAGGIGSDGVCVDSVGNVCQIFPPTVDLPPLNCGYDTLVRVFCPA